MTKNIHAARATDGLPASGRAAWRVCAECNTWVIAAWVDRLPVALYPKPLPRDKIITALRKGYPLYRVTGGMDGVVKGSVVWVSPARLARWLLDNPDAEPENIHLEHPHHRFKDIDPDAKPRRLSSQARRNPDNPPPF